MVDILQDPDIVICDKKVVHWHPGACMPEGITIGLRKRKIFIKAPGGVTYITLRWFGPTSKKARFMGDAFERGYGNLEWRGIIPERVMPWYCVSYDGVNCEGFGVKVRPNAFCYWQIDESGVSLTLDLRCGTCGAIIEEELCAAELVYDISGDSPFLFLKEFCMKMADSPLTPAEPVYGSNSWYYCYSASNRELIVKDAILLEELTAGLENRPYAVVDCGWSESVNPGDPCPGTAGTVVTAAFGNMKELADEVKRHNVRPGLWLRPLCISSGERYPKEMQLQRGNPSDPYSYLDPSVPEALELIARDVKRVTLEWGYELIKYDFTTFDILRKFHPESEMNCTSGDWCFRDNRKTSAQIIKDLYRTILESASGAVIIGCNCIGHLGSGYFHIYRVGDDTSGKVWERTRLMGINTLAFRLCQHKALFDIDADCVGQTESMPWNMNKKWLELLSSSGTPLFVSIHPEKITEEQKIALKSSYIKASKQTDVLEPLGFTDSRCPDSFLVNGEIKKFDWLEETGVIDFYI